MTREELVSEWYKSTDKWWEENIKDQIHVFDNIIDRDYQDEIKDLLLGDTVDFPWYFIPDITGYPEDDEYLSDMYEYKDQFQARAAFGHEMVRDGVLISKFNKRFMRLIKTSCSKVNKEHSKVVVGRSFLQLPSGIDPGDPDSPHVDIGDKHFVVLYYVLDSDGDTIIYDQQDYDATDASIIKGETELTIRKRVTPKQGRVVIFDGRFYHTAEQPSKDIRCVINFNLI